MGFIMPMIQSMCEYYLFFDHISVLIIGSYLFGYSLRFSRFSLTLLSSTGTTMASANERRVTCLDQLLDMGLRLQLLQLKTVGLQLINLPTTRSEILSLSLKRRRCAGSMIILLRYIAQETICKPALSNMAIGREIFSRLARLLATNPYLSQPITSHNP